MSGNAETDRCQSPVRLCCGQRHLGARCPDGLVMCSLCFERVPDTELVRDEHDPSKRWDVCLSCACPGVGSYGHGLSAQAKFACALCGVSPAAGHATVTEGDTVRWLCHDTPGRSCYVRWTVYGERPTPAVVVADPDHTSGHTT